LGMGLARSRRRIPLEQARYPLSRTALNERCLQPGIEALRRLLRTRSELPQVVVTQAAADDQYALFAQRRERAARRHMNGRIVSTLERELHDRQLSRRIHHS